MNADTLDRASDADVGKVASTADGTLSSKVDDTTWDTLSRIEVGDGVSKRVVSPSADVASEVSLVESSMPMLVSSNKLEVASGSTSVSGSTIVVAIADSISDTDAIAVSEVI